MNPSQILLDFAGLPFEYGQSPCQGEDPIGAMLTLSAGLRARAQRSPAAFTDSEVKWLSHLVENGLAEIYQDDFLDPAVGPLTRRTVATPSAEVISWLQQYGKEQRSDHHRLVDAAHKQGSNGNGGGGNDWQKQAESPVFRILRTFHICPPFGR